MVRTSVVFSCFCLLAACGSGADDGPIASGGASGGIHATAGQTATGGTSGGSASGGATVSGGAETGGSGGRASGGNGGAGAGGTASTGGQTVTAGQTGGQGGHAAGGSTGGKEIGGATGGTGGVGGKGGAGGMASGGTASGGSPGTGGGSGSCTTPPAPSALIGWAAQSGGSVSTTTGGGTAEPTVVTTLADLQAAVKGTTAAVIHVKGVMAAGSLAVGSNKTIVGLCGAEIHGHVEVNGSTNVIIRNLKIVGYGVGNCALDPDYDSSVGCSSGQDAISVQKNAHHIWFDHCDISDGTDGNLDISNGANYVTVSWTKFHYTPRTDNSGSDSTGAAGHRFSNLVGGTDKPSTYDDANALNVTWHHNWWADNVVERQPRVRFGKNHIFNNLYSAEGDNYCVRAGIKAQLLIESNVFSGVKNPHAFNSTADEDTASITSKSNTYSNTSGTQATGGGGPAFTSPPYQYSADATSGLQAAIQGGAGPK